MFSLPKNFQKFFQKFQNFIPKPSVSVQSKIFTPAFDQPPPPMFQQHPGPPQPGPQQPNLRPITQGGPGQPNSM